MSVQTPNLRSNMGVLTHRRTHTLTFKLNTAFHYMGRFHREPERREIEIEIKREMEGKGGRGREERKRGKIEMKEWEREREREIESESERERETYLMHRGPQ